jgi:hypothetical protein
MVVITHIEDRRHPHAHGMRNEITASEQRNRDSFSMEIRSFCVILRGLIVPDSGSVVTDRAENQNDRRSYEHG